MVRCIVEDLKESRVVTCFGGRSPKSSSRQWGGERCRRRRGAATTVRSKQWRLERKQERKIRSWIWWQLMGLIKYVKQRRRKRKRKTRKRKTTHPRFKLNLPLSQYRNSSLTKCIPLARLMITVTSKWNGDIKFGRVLLTRIVSFDSNTWRTTSEEKRAAERMKEEDYNDLRRAAEVHRQVLCHLNIWLRLIIVVVAN